MNSSSNNIWFLMARSLSGEATEEESLQLKECMQKNPALQKGFDYIKKSWSHQRIENSVSTSDEIAESKKISRILQLARVEEAVKSTSPHFTFHITSKLVMKYAAFLIICVSIYIIRSQIKSYEVKPEKLVTQNGSRSRTILPDGSTVWLNAGSKIFYEKDFCKTTREIRLEGEAFFDVIKEPGRPFIVHTGGIDIKVLGTAFNVKSYPEDKSVETTLLRGLVQVTKAGQSKSVPILLHPHQKLIVDKILVDQLPSPVAGSYNSKIPTKDFIVVPLNEQQNENERPEIAWIYNRLEFRGLNFEELAKKLERWYNVSIVFEDETVRKLNFNGSFENETVEQAFEALQTANKFNYKINGHEILVKSP
jgi:transmembrane sensor